MPSFYPFSDLTGGGAGALDALDGAGLANGDIAFVAIEDNALYDDVALIYVLDADSAATEAVPDVIAPDANGGDKRWLLVNFVSKAIMTRTAVLTKAADATLTADDMMGQQIGNVGQVANVTITLPPIARGLKALFALGATAGFFYRLDPNAADLIYLDGDPGADGEYVQVASVAAGNMLWIEAFETASGVYDWYATTISGSWVAE